MYLYGYMYTHYHAYMYYRLAVAHAFRGAAPRDYPGTTRWSTTLSWKVNLPHAINVRASSGANLVAFAT